jgi:membrane dipeptidase
VGVAQTCVVIALAAVLGACAHAPQHPRAVHEALLTLDSHLDTPLSLMRPDWDITQRHAFSDDMSQVDLPRMIDGGLDGGFFVIFTGQGPRTPEGHAEALDVALERAEAIRRMVAAHPDRFALALNAADAAPIAASGKRIVFMSIENAYPLGRDPANLARFQQLGVRMLGLVHFANNDTADSATDPKGPEWNGLSPLGRQMVAEANRLGLVLDQSHASDAVFDDLLRLSATPIVLSHSGCRAIYDHPRNIDDERLRRLAAAGGVIQINSLGDYLTKLPDTPERDAAVKALRAEYGPLDELTPERRAAFRAAYVELNRRYPSPLATIDDVMKHLLHALQVAGVDHVGIGLDWDGGGGVDGMNDVGAIPEITTRLMAAGYSKADLEKIWGGNLLRVLRAAEDHARKAADGTRS